MSPAEQKHAMRRAILARLKAIPVDAREEYSAKLRELLSAYLQTDTPLNIALYAPLPHEVNLLPLLQQYPWHHYAFPRCLPQRQLVFHHVKNAENELHPEAMEILTPAAELPIIEPQHLDIIIVPGVAFTRHGLRIGYGGGYYDRYLPHCAQAKLISLAFPQQMVEHIPTEAHDLRIPLVLNI